MNDSWPEGLHTPVSVIACLIAFCCVWELTKLLAGLVALAGVVVGTGIGAVLNEKGYPLLGALAAGLSFALFAQPAVLILKIHFLESQLGRLQAEDVQENGQQKSLLNTLKEFSASALAPVPVEQAPREGGIKALAGRDAVQYAYATETQWFCVCGTRNALDKSRKIQNCSRCHRNRDFVLANYTRPLESEARDEDGSC